MSDLDHHPIDCPEGCTGCMPEDADRCEDCNGTGQLVSPTGVDFCHICDGRGYLIEPATLVPRVGDTFEHHGNRFRVTGWLCPAVRQEPPADERSFWTDMIDDVLFETQQRVGPDRVRLRFCTPEEVVYVSGAGVCGCIVRIADVVVDGRVPWSDDALASHHESALRRAGTPLR